MNEKIEKLLTEDLIGLKDVPDFLPAVEGKKKTHYATIYRWWKTGVQGVHLEVASLGSKMVTSKQAVTRFLIRLSEVKSDC